MRFLAIFSSFCCPPEEEEEYGDQELADDGKKHVGQSLAWREVGIIELLALLALVVMIISIPLLIIWIGSLPPDSVLLAKTEKPDIVFDAFLVFSALLVVVFLCTCMSEKNGNHLNGVNHVQQESVNLTIDEVGGEDAEDASGLLEDEKQALL